MPIARRSCRAALAALLSAALVAPTLLAPAAVAQEAQEQEPVKKDVPYVPTPQELVDKMLEMAKVSDKDVVYDLGCGDGRMVVTAAKKYGARGVGVDIDPQRIAESNDNAKKAGVTDKVKFIKGDLFQMDFSEATVLTLYLLPSVNEKLRPKILKLKPGTRVVSHAFSMGDWEPDDQAEVEGRTAYYWTVPANVDGTWIATVKDGGQDRKVALNLDQEYQKVTGTAEIDGKRAEIKDAKLQGDQLTFALATDGQGAKTYTCRIAGSQMEGRPVGGNADDAQAASFVARREGGQQSQDGQSEQQQGGRRQSQQQGQGQGQGQDQGQQDRSRTKNQD